MVRKVGAVLLLPLILAALMLTGAGALFGGVWSVVAFDKKRRKQIAVESALSTVLRGAKEMK